MLDRTPAERLDHALDGLEPGLAGRGIPADPELRDLLSTAGRLRAALAPIPVSPRFDERMARHLGVRHRRPLATPEWVHLPGWLMVTGAVSSVGVGLTAYALWRGTRRGAAHRTSGH